MHALENSNVWIRAGCLFILTCMAIVALPPSTFATSQVRTSQAGRLGKEVPFPQVGGESSWGLGIVVPDGSGLTGGGTVNWAEVNNVTAVLQIPNLTNVTAATYAVVSIMTQDGVVLQTAYGAFPGEDRWLVYAMFITNLNQIPQQYTWAANASEPAAEPGDIVAISIYQSEQGAWGFKASNFNASLSVQKSFGANTTEAPRRGDQEVLAMESYANSSSMFQEMGNMTMLSLSLNGKKVDSGWYLFSDWDLVHNPLFIVGGATPVPFVDLSILKDGTAVWYYSGNWVGTGAVGGFNPFLVAVVILLGAALTSVFLSMRFIRKRTVEVKVTGRSQRPSCIRSQDGRQS